jgi:membrane fusion protein (multidrug efflux system)
LLSATSTALIAGGIYYGYNYLQSPKNNSTMQIATPAVSVFKVEKKSIYPEASFVAKIESQDKVDLRARVTGFLQERLFNEGDVIQEGQPLFIIEKVNFEAKVREAEANLFKAEAQSINAKSQYERTKTLFKTKDVSEAKLDETKAAYDTSMAAVNQMKANLDLAKKDLEYTIIKSPMSGKIGESQFSVGELIGPDSGVLATIVKINPIDAVFSVSENEMLSLNKQVRSGTTMDDVKVQFFTSDGLEYPEQGHLSFVDNRLDEAMNTLKVKASFPNPNGTLISGQYGRIVLTGKNTVTDLVIPMRAVQRDMLGAFVYVVGPDNVVQKREIKTGAELSNFDIVVLDGLKIGERVIIEGFQKIQPNISVSPTIVDLNAVAPETAK